MGSIITAAALTLMKTARLYNDEAGGRDELCRLILIPNVNASLHRFFCSCAMSLLSQRSSATLPFVCSSHRDKITLCFGCINVLHQYNRIRFERPGQHPGVFILIIRRLQFCVKR